MILHVVADAESDPINRMGRFNNLNSPATETSSNPMNIAPRNRESQQDQRKIGMAGVSCVRAFDCRNRRTEAPPTLRKLSPELKWNCRGVLRTPTRQSLLMANSGRTWCAPAQSIRINWDLRLPVTCAFLKLTVLAVGALSGPLL